MVTCVLSTDGRHLAGGRSGKDGSLTYVSLADGGVFTKSDHRGYYLWLAISGDGRFVGWWTETAAHIWDSKAGAEVRAVADATHGPAPCLEPRRQPFRRRDPRQGPTLDRSRWDTRTGKMLARFQGHTAGIGCIAFSPDSRRIATGSSDKTIMIWDVESGQRLFALRGHHSTIATLAFSPDNKRLASCSHDGTVRIWDVRPFDAAE